MCRHCEGSFPSPADHRSLSELARQLRDRVTAGGLKAEEPEFVAEIRQLDARRFAGPFEGSSPEWGQPGIATATRELLFSSLEPNPLTLFVLTCWYDAQESYVTVWSRRLAALRDWMMNGAWTESTLPKARSGPWTRSTVWKTWNTCRDIEFSGWMVRAIREILQEHPEGDGNVWRFVGRIGTELVNLGQENRLAFRDLSFGRFSPALLKRAWMLTMFLRRDRGIVRCLVNRTLERVAGGKEAANAWYNDSKFPERECELPVDKRMLNIGNEIFRGGYLDERGIMVYAHRWAAAHGLPPSVLDVLFFAMD